MLLIVLVLASPYVYQLFYKNRAINLTGFDAAVAKLKNGNAADSNKIAVGHAKLFAFNPNHLPDAQWKKLGLIDQQIKVIKNYEAKGGRFYNKQDLKKIYVITADDYNRLQAYISLPDKADYQAKTFTGIVIEINTADSAKLTQHPGDWRRCLLPGLSVTGIGVGGFYNKEQLNGRIGELMRLSVPRIEQGN
jgi:competence protein ComEA